MTPPAITAPPTLPRLLAGVGQRAMTDLGEHLRVHGAVPELAADAIVGAVERAGLRGHGGAAFPTGRKMRTVAARRKPKIVVANGTEGEPASKKDRVLLREVPHLVLDGAALAARAVGAKEAIVAISETDVRGADALAQALAQRRERGTARGEPDWQLVQTPERYLSGQESALMNFLNGGPGLPTFGPRPFERGVRGRPTLVQNVETLAHVALIARHGPDWFRSVGTAGHPGSTMLTVSGAVSAPGVYEIEPGMRLADLLSQAQCDEPLSAVLLGGYFGTWVAAHDIPAARLAGDDLAALGASLGAGVLVALPRSACPVAETARVTEYFSAQAAGQCGPCVNGLGAIAYTVGQVAGGAATRADLGDLARWSRELRGRGACQHPDGAVRFLASALEVFGTEFQDHARHGACERCAHRPVLPTPLPVAA